MCCRVLVLFSSVSELTIFDSQPVQLLFFLLLLHLTRVKVLDDILHPIDPIDEMVHLHLNEA